MPQMAPIFWLGLLFFFLMILMMFLMLNYPIKPFKKAYSPSINYTLLKPFWKL
uniref:ATP synthase F0 subunit 8 n=1 Tax=Potamiscus yongshengensis TaxID=2682931 RepID=A0A650F364_9EUCA|nr:ATP synthase F0 subunit 8 [Potamiscus yongshengensis]